MNEHYKAILIVLLVTFVAVLGMPINSVILYVLVVIIIGKQWKNEDRLDKLEKDDDR